MGKEGPDFISNLPRDVLTHIVSMIPLKQAIRTAVLSSVWRSFWLPIQVNLDFCSAQISCYESCREKLKQLLAAELKSYDYPEKFKFCLQSGDDIKKIADNSKVKDDFLAIVTKGTDRDLHFDFSRTLVVAGKFNLILEPGTLSCPFSSLKSLRLRFVTHGTGILVKDLFSSCQFLENLTLEKCIGLQSVDIKANHCLKNLSIADCSTIVNITLCAPGLNTFSYRGVLPNLELTNTPFLAQVTLNLRDGLGHNCFNCEDVLSLLSSLKDVEILTLSGWLLEWLCSSGVIFSRLDFKFNKLKELWWIASEMDSSKRDSLACFLNMTPALESLFVKIDPNYNTIKCPFFHTYWHDPHLWMDYATVKCNASLLTHLKIIEMVGFTSKRDELLLMDLLLHKAVKLKDMIIVSSESDTAWRVVVIPRRQVDYIVKQHQNHRLLSSSPNGYSFYLLIEAKVHSGYEASNGLGRERSLK